MISLNIGSGSLEKIRPEVVTIMGKVGGKWVFGDKYVKGEEIVEMDARKIPYPNETFDNIYAGHILEHFRRTETADVLEEWKRVLKKGGILYIETPDMEGIAQAIVGIEERGGAESKDQTWNAIFNGLYAGTDDVTGHDNGFTKTTLWGWLRATGFEVLSIKRDQRRLHFVLDAVAKKP